jgi:hypothetical protein
MANGAFTPEEQEINTGLRPADDPQDAQREDRINATIQRLGGNEVTDLPRDAAAIRRAVLTPPDPFLFGEDVARVEDQVQNSFLRGGRDIRIPKEQQRERPGEDLLPAERADALREGKLTPDQFREVFSLPDQGGNLGITDPRVNAREEFAGSIRERGVFGEMGEGWRMAGRAGKGFLRKVTTGLVGEETANNLFPPDDPDDELIGGFGGGRRAEQRAEDQAERERRLKQAGGPTDPDTIAKAFNLPVGEWGKDALNHMFNEWLKTPLAGLGPSIENLVKAETKGTLLDTGITVDGKPFRPYATIAEHLDSLRGRPGFAKLKKAAAKLFEEQAPVEVRLAMGRVRTDRDLKEAHDKAISLANSAAQIGKIGEKRRAKILADPVTAMTTQETFAIQQYYERRSIMRAINAAGVRDWRGRPSTEGLNMPALLKVAMEEARSDVDTHIKLRGVQLAEQVEENTARNREILHGIESDKTSAEIQIARINLRGTLLLRELGVEEAAIEQVTEILKSANEGNRESKRAASKAKESLRTFLSLDPRMAEIFDGLGDGGKMLIFQTMLALQVQGSTFNSQGDKVKALRQALEKENKRQGSATPIPIPG